MALETRSGFKENHREFGMHIRSEEARTPANVVARKIASRANATAPVGEDDGKDNLPLKGSYHAITGRKAGNLRVGRNSRAIAKVVSKAPSARWAEGGNKNQKPQRTLLHAAIAVSVEMFGHFDGSEQ